jgi:hypothetical protein
MDLQPDEALESTKRERTAQFQMRTLSQIPMVGSFTLARNATAEDREGGVMSIREDLRSWSQDHHLQGNPDGTVFVGIPEIRDLAHRFWTSSAAVSRAVNQIAREYHLTKIKACNGDLGYEIRKEWF